MSWPGWRQPQTSEAVNARVLYAFSLVEPGATSARCHQRLDQKPWVIIVASADGSGLTSGLAGAGIATNVCKDCQLMPREQHQRIERLDELYGFLDQSNISSQILRY